jgi:hypothetical protein
MFLIPHARRARRLLALSIASTSILVAPGLHSESHDGPEADIIVTPQPVGFTESFVQLISLGASAEVVSQGTGTIKGTFSFDFDTGRMSGRNATAPPRRALDVFWRMKTEVDRALEPMNGTRIGVIGARDFDAVSYLDVADTAVARTPINGSADGRNRLRAGTVLAIVTSDGHYGKIGITRYGRDLGIRWEIWAGGPETAPPVAPGSGEIATPELRTRTFSLELASSTGSGTLATPIEAPALHNMRIATISDAEAGQLLEVEPQLNATVLRQLKVATEARRTDTLSPSPTSGIELSPMLLQSLPWHRDQIVPIEDFEFAVELHSTPGGTEPSNIVSSTPVEVFGGLLQAVSVPFAELSPVYWSVYADANADSGIYYYLPRAYNIAWDAEVPDARGLGLRIAYEQLSTPGETTNAVRMAVLLDAEIHDFADLEFVRRLVEMQSRRLGFTFRALKPFPLAAPPAISLVDDLATRFNLDPEQIHITRLSDALDRIELSWVTDPVTAANIRLTLTEGFGLNGAAQFVSPDVGAPSPLIPVNVQIASTDAFGWLPFRRDAPIWNAAPFPVRLGHLHALIEQGGRPVVHSWSLGDAKLSAGGSVTLDTVHVPTAVDAVAARMWMTYALDRSCASCVSEALNRIVIGNVGPPAMQMSMTLLTPLADTGTALLQVETRSRYLDPNDRAVRTGPTLTFATDGTTQPVGFFFRSNAAEVASTGSDIAPEEQGPVYQYRVSAIRATGEPCSGQTWLDASGETTFVGSFQVRQSTGTSCGAE